MRWGAGGTDGRGHTRFEEPEDLNGPKVQPKTHDCVKCGERHPQSIMRDTTPKTVIQEIVELHVERGQMKSYKTCTHGCNMDCPICGAGPYIRFKAHPPSTIKRLTKVALDLHLRRDYTCYYCLGIKDREIDVPPTPVDDGGIAVHECVPASVGELAGFCTICGRWSL